MLVQRWLPLSSSGHLFSQCYCRKVSTTLTTWDHADAGLWRRMGTGMLLPAWVIRKLDHTDCCLTDHHQNTPGLKKHSANTCEMALGRSHTVINKCTSIHTGTHTRKNSTEQSPSRAQYVFRQASSAHVSHPVLSSPL